MSFLKAMSNYQLPDELKQPSTLLDQMSRAGISQNMDTATRNQKMYYGYAGSKNLFQDVGKLYRMKYGSSLEEDINRVAEFYGITIEEALETEAGQLMLDSFWDLLVEESAPDQQRIENEFGKQMTMFMNVIDLVAGEKLSDLQKDHTKNILFDMLAGEDQILTPEELSHIGNLLTTAYQDIIAKGFEGSEFGGSMTDIFLKDVLGNIASLLTESQVSDITSLLDAGVKPIDLSEFIQHLIDTDELGGADLYMGYVSKIQQGIANALGKADWSELTQWNQDWADIVGDNPEMLLQIQSLIDAGYDISFLNRS